jgi:glycosyltransferase involved in cell wall biosynthesis
LNAVRFARFFTKKQFTQTVIIPDIPKMVTAMNNQNPLKRYILKVRNNKAMKMTSQSDGLVLLTENMMDFIKRPLPYIVMEGIVDVNTMDRPYDAGAWATEEIIMYAGTLRQIFGVMNLVEAFRSIKNENIQLWICGSGDCRETIEKAAAEDSRIKYWGFVDSQKALELQRIATILVNPRTSEGEYTKYSFPSKTMEYLLSGKSVIINRLPGIPEEYLDYVFMPDDESVESLAECIKAVMAMEPQDRLKMSESGRNFIIQSKNSVIQTGRILELIKGY